MNTRQLLLLAFSLILLALAIVLAGDAGQWLFDTLKLHQRQLAEFTDASPWLAGGVYALLFVTATALSVPAATALTIAAGAVFGFGEALLLTMFAGAAGATLAMLLARHALRAWVEAKWPEWVGRINRGIERDGAFYLLTLRLSPVPPFFVVNVAMGLTRMRARTFCLVTLAGVAPLDAVFVSAGHLLAQLHAPGDALTLPVLVAFALVGLVPLLMRLGLRRWRRHRRARGRQAT